MTQVKLKIFWKIAFIVLISTAFFFRLFPILNDTTHFSFDQGLDIIMVKKLVVDHQLNLISRYSGLQGVLMGPVWTYFLAIPFIIFGGNPSGNIIFMSLFNLTISSLAAFFIAKKFGKPIGLITWLFFLFSPSFVTGSQVILSPYPLIPLFILFPLLINEIMVQKKSFFTWVLFLLLGIYFQFEVGFAIFAALAHCVLFFYFRSWWLFKKRNFWIGIGLFCLTFLPQLIFDLRHNFLISTGVLAYLNGNNTSLYRDSAPLVIRFGQRLYSFYEDATAMVFFGHWIVNLGLIFLTLLGWRVVIKKKIQSLLNFLKINLITLTTFFIGFSFYPGPIWGWYRIGLPAVYVFLVAIPLAVLWTNVKILRSVILVILAALFIKGLNPLGLYSLYLNPGNGGVGTLRNQKIVIDYVYSQANGKPFNFLIYTPPVYDYIWQYDFWWYGQKKYGYLPSNWQMAVPLLGIGQQAKVPTATETLFLIIEPNSDHPDEARNWQKNIIAGSPVSQKTFSSGISVEKWPGQ